MRGGTGGEDSTRRGGRNPLWYSARPAPLPSGATTGTDIRGAQVYDENNRTRGPSFGVLVPVADQAWPDAATNADGQSVVLFSDNRSGRFNLYAIRIVNFRLIGHEFPVLLNKTP